LTATPNPNLTQIKMVAGCSCGFEIFQWVDKQTLEPVTPSENVWLHVDTLKSACPHYLDALLEDRAGQEMARS